MCGIFGMVSADGGAVDFRRSTEVLDMLADRGPDDRGWYDGSEVVLGHTRLSIMDLSAAGHQPMSNDDQTVWVTFNGEIYRFWELRKELESHGHRFRSRSDTEVIVRGYEQWGRGVLDRIDGMFALGVWDARGQTLLLARDRLGKKPLFWTHTSRGLAFSSLLRPLVAAGLASASIDVAALREFLFLNYVIGPKTIFRDVELLAPGTWLEYRRGTVTTGRYWSLADERMPDRGDPQATFERLLVDAVRQRLVSDAPVGMFFSGGVDSAVITALAQRDGDHRQLTFSVGFDETSYDERPKAERAARRLGTEHHDMVCRAEDIVELLPWMVASADHLLADQSMIPLALLARKAKGSVKVVLTGDGGDELLAGYSTYRALELASVYTRLVPAALRSRAAGWAGRLPGGTGKMSTSMLAQRFLQATTGSLARAHASWRAIWSHAEIDALLGGRCHQLQEWRAYADHFGAGAASRWPLVKRGVHADVSTWLVDSILAKLDRATMASGLEARSPLLDSALVEHAFDVLLADGGGQHGKASKAAVRAFARKLLGRDLAGTRKEGFQTPLAPWFAGPLRPYVREQIDRLADGPPGLLDLGIARRMEEEHAAGRHDHALKLWSLVVLAEWLRLFPDASVA